VFGLLLVWSQALLLPLDVANNHFYPNSGGIDMKVLWYIVYMSSLVMITVLLPYAMLFYETDEERPMCKRLLTALCYLCIALTVTLIILLVSWVFLKYADIPVTVISLQYDGTVSSQTTDNLLIVT
jgi:LMBR1 domain-containing protein 1